MKEYIGGFIKNGAVKTLPKPDTPLHFQVKSEIEKQEIEFCLNCTRKKCSGVCPEFKDFHFDLVQKYKNKEKNKNEAENRSN